MLRLSGIGKMKSNTLVLGFKDNWKTSTDLAIKGYVDIINNAFELNCGLAILRLKGDERLVEEDGESSSTDSIEEEEDEVAPTTGKRSKRKESEVPEEKSLTANAEEVEIKPAVSTFHRRSTPGRAASCTSSRWRCAASPAWARASCRWPTWWRNSASTSPTCTRWKTAGSGPVKSTSTSSRTSTPNSGWTTTRSKTRKFSGWSASGKWCASIPRRPSWSCSRFRSPNRMWRHPWCTWAGWKCCLLTCRLSCWCGAIKPMYSLFIPK